MGEEEVIPATVILIPQPREKDPWDISRANGLESDAARADVDSSPAVAGSE